MRSTGHRFSGVERKTLLELLARRALSLGVEIHWRQEIRDLSDCGLPRADLIVAADGAASGIRETMADRFQPQIDLRRNRFVWLGSTRPFPAFTFYFKPSPAGLWRVHAYQYAPGRSTFIVEAREETWQASGLDENDERATVAYLERLFADELQGHPLIENRSIWRRFPTVRNARWHSGNVVLLGDAAHTAHFSVGSGTKLAMEDAIALAAALEAQPSISRRARGLRGGAAPQVESLQRAAQASLEWFESVERYHDTEPLQFAFNLLTRSLRITHENLRVRDPGLVAQVDRWFAEQAAKQSGRAVPSDPCASAAVHAVPAPRPGAAEPDRRVVHVPVPGGGRTAQRLAPRASRQPRHRRRRPGDDGDDRREPRGPHLPGVRRDVSSRSTSPRGGGSWTSCTRESEGKIGMQLSHAGRKGSTRLLWEGEDEPLPEGNWPLIAPSPIPYRPHNQTPREMTRGDMDQVLADFVRATGMADAAGFDLLELHLAHGYLLASFISPLTNRRTDAYGGSLANRMRYPLEVVSRCAPQWPAGQAAVGQDLGGRLGAGRHGGARCGGGRADGGRRRSRHRRRVGGPDGPRGEAGLRPPVSDAIQRPDPPRGAGADDDGGKYLVAGRRQHHPRGRPGGSRGAGAGTSVGSVLDPPRGGRPGVSAPLAADVRDAQSLQAADEVEDGAYQLVGIGRPAGASLKLNRCWTSWPNRLSLPHGRPESGFRERGHDRLGKTGIVALHHMDGRRVHPAHRIHDVGGVHLPLDSPGTQLWRIDRRSTVRVPLHDLVHLEHAVDDGRERGGRAQGLIGSGPAPVALVWSRLVAATRRIPSPPRATGRPGRGRSPVCPAGRPRPAARSQSTGPAARGKGPWPPARWSEAGTCPSWWPRRALSPRHVPGC